MTICQALLWAREKLAKNNITSAELDAEVILGYVLGKAREWILMNGKCPPASEFARRRSRAGKMENGKLLKYKTLINQRLKGLPVAYLTKHKEFFGLDFYVDERVLVPRPETEMLVRETLETLESRESLEARETSAHEISAYIKASADKHNTRRITIVDVGTGSGCIAISIARQLKARLANLAFRDVTIYATDISKEALAVARKNAKRHKVDIKFLQGDLLEPIIKRKIRPDIIGANLPYLRPDQIKGDIKWEPRKALWGGDDGLELYEKLLKQMAEMPETLPCRRDSCLAGRRAQIPASEGEEGHPRLQGVLEIDPSQTKAMQTLIKKCLPRANIKIRKDLAGRERLVIINY